MPDRRSFGEVHLDVTVGRKPIELKPDSDTPFRIAILGDFSGRENRHLTATGDDLANRQPVLIDRDNFDSVFAKFAPRLEIHLGGDGGQPVALQFAELDDFHPDNLFRKVPLFQKLRETREKLNDAKTFAQTARELGLRAAVPDTPAPVRPQARSDSHVEQALSGNFLDQLVEETERKSEQRQASRVADPWLSLVRGIIAPHIVPKADPRQAEAVGLIDLATSAQMSALLHLPAFQALEAAWRAVYFLVRNLETDSRLKVLLIDVSKEELARDLASSPDLISTGAYRLLVEKSVGTPGAEPWAVLIGNCAFGNSLEDAEVLARMAQVAAAAGAPFIAAATPAVLECDSIDDLSDPRKWTAKLTAEQGAARHALQGLSAARYLGLVLPRFLGRLPYGKDTESTEQFEFEEMPDVAAHEDYLWLNPAFAVALLLGQTFSQQGWQMRLGTLSDISGLPLHVYSEDGAPQSKPCAEVLMTQTAAEGMLEKGVMPLASIKEQPAARLIRFQSFSNPPAPLAGRWEQ